MTVGRLIDQIQNLDREMEVVLIMPNGPEAVWWNINVERNGPLAIIAMMLVKPLLRDPRAFHGWLDDVGLSVGLDGKTMELRLRSLVIPRLVHDRRGVPPNEISDGQGS